MKKLFYIMMIFAYACNSTNKTSVEWQDENQYRSIKLIDTFQNVLTFSSANNVTIADFHPMYIGKIKDTILLNYNSSEAQYRTLDWMKYKKPVASGLEIWVDTSRLIGSVVKKINAPPPVGSKKTIAFSQNFYRGKSKSFPVFIKNTSKYNLIVGYGEYISLITEAQDSTGNWLPIQESYNYYCGTGLSYFYLPPNEITITSRKLFKGNYKTKIRLAFGVEGKLKSNEFHGEINYNQFKKMKNKE